MKFLQKIQQASQEMLTCRDEGHFWAFARDEVTTGMRNQIVEFTQIRRCPRCETVRRRTVAVPSFQIVSSSYTYPEGYLTQKGSRISRTDVRREVFSRMAETLDQG